MPDKVRLIETAGMNYTQYYDLDGYINFFYGCLTPIDCYIHRLTWFLIRWHLLRIPQRDNPTE